MNRYGLQPRAHVGMGAVLALLAAGASIYASFAGYGIWGLILGIISLPLGLVGMLTAVSPHVRGGFLSMIAIALGILGIILSVLALLGVLTWPF